MVILYLTGAPCFAVQGGMYSWIKVPPNRSRQIVELQLIILRLMQYQVGFLPLKKSGMPLPYEFWPEHLQRYILRSCLESLRPRRRY